jgi:peptide chain release factor 1
MLPADVVQDRITDHRIGFACGMQGALDGDLDPLIFAIIEDYKSRRLQDIIAGIDVDT